MSDEAKIVINLKENRATIGVQSPECDPVFTCAEGTMGEIFESAGRLLVDAEAKWKENPRCPKSDLPQPAPVPARAAPTAARPAPKTQQLF